MNRRLCCVMFAVISLLLLSLPRPALAQDAPEYSYLTFDPPTTMGNNASWNSINNSGEMVGAMIDAKTGIQVALIYQNGVFTEVSIPHSTFTFLSTVNDHGTAVGSYGDSKGLYHGFTRDAKGKITYLPDILYGGNTLAFGINDNGVIVGGFTPTHSGFVTAFIYQHGVYTSYKFPGSQSTLLGSLRNQNLIVGSYLDANLVIHTFVLVYNAAPYQITFPIVYPGPYQTGGNDINNLGEVVGDFFNSKVAEGFLLSNGVYTKISFPGAVATSANGINDDGVIVGNYVDTKGVTHGMVAAPLP